MAALVVLAGLGVPLFQVNVPPSSFLFAALLGLLFLSLGLAPHLRPVGAAGWILVGVTWPIATMYLPWFGPARFLAILGGAAATYLAYRTWNATDPSAHASLRRASLVILGVMSIGLTQVLMLDAGVSDPGNRLLVGASAAVATLFATGIHILPEGGRLIAWYPSRYCHPTRTDLQSGFHSDAAAAHCASLPEGQQVVTTYVENDGWLGSLLTYSPGGGVEEVLPVSFGGGMEVMTYIALLLVLLGMGRARWSAWVSAPVLLVAGRIVQDVLMMVLYGTGRTSHWFANLTGWSVWTLCLGAVAILVLRRPGVLDGILPILDAADAEPDGAPARPRTVQGLDSTTQHL